MEDTITIGETCGIEFECDDLNSNNNIPVRNWKKTHDASIETPTCFINSLGGISVKETNLIKLLSYYNGQRGVEIVSPILDTEDDSLLDTLKNLTNTVFLSGESLRSTRSGIHYHISLPNPTLQILKNIIRFGRYFEPLFFYVGTMGYKFRGEENDSIYCRPITSFGPPCVHYYGDYAQVFNSDDLLKAKTRNDFWYLYGDCQNHGGRYNPVRYTWLNLYPLAPWGQYRGTLEFRIFNKTLNPLFIYSTLILCKKFVHLVLSSSFGKAKELGFLEENSIFDNTIDKEKVFGLLFKLDDAINIEPEIIRILLNIIEQAPKINLNTAYVHTHIRTRGENRYWDSSSYSPKVIKGSNIKKPKYIDIHVLRGEA